jgi:hypothetical protein
MSLGYLAVALWQLGYVTQAIQRTDQSIGLAMEIGHPFISLSSFHWAAIASFLAGDRVKTRRYAEEESRISTEYGFPFGELGSSMPLAWLDATDGDREAVDRLRFSVDAQRAVGVRAQLTISLFMLADACRYVGRIEDGLDAVSEGLAEAEETGERPWEAELHRVRGRLIAERNPAEAEKSMRTALAIARGQQARSFEFRSAIDLAELLAGTDRQKEIVALVAELEDGFVDGRGTPDHARAEKLITGS